MTQQYLKMTRNVKFNGDLVANEMDLYYSEVPRQLILKRGTFQVFTAKFLCCRSSTADEIEGNATYEWETYNQDLKRTKN